MNQYDNQKEDSDARARNRTYPFQIVEYEIIKSSLCCKRELVETAGGLMCSWCGAPDYSNKTLCGISFPHDFQIEDQGEQVDMKCVRCGRNKIN